MALLIGKRLDKKGPPGGDKPMMGGDDEGGEMDKESVENSAISDFMSAKSPEEAKAALKQFLEACYPSLAGEGGEEAAEGEGY
jgi:hypothetical protein